MIDKKPQDSHEPQGQPAPHDGQSVPVPQTPAGRPQRSNLAKFLMMIGLFGVAQRMDRTTPTVAAGQNTSSNRVLLQVIQPGLAGLMDGSVSTLAPIFATAFATHLPMTAFLVGMAAATGAGISMAFSEALSDDGVLTGRGNPVLRGAITGLMTFLGGAGHTLPFLIQNLHYALIVAYIVVGIELTIIAAIRHRYFGTRWAVSILQVIGGGALVFAAGFLFGSA
ncbi:MAG TPA: VIT family protein [Ktedonobacteraceae bacterium]|nr:VIT family protein [Ktedonobacteraceae bacterium]